MLYQTVIVLCLNTTPVMDCNIRTANSWIPWPQPAQTIDACFKQGRDIGPHVVEFLLGPGLYQKVICQEIKTKSQWGYEADPEYSLAPP